MPGGFLGFCPPVVIRESHGHCCSTFTLHCLPLIYSSSFSLFPLHITLCSACAKGPGTQKPSGTCLEAIRMAVKQQGLCSKVCCKVYCLPRCHLDWLREFLSHPKEISLKTKPPGSQEAPKTHPLPLWTEI